MTPRPLPEEAQRLCDLLDAPPRLVAHLRLVHDAAVDLVAALAEKFPGIDFDREAVLFGASTHDLGKVLYPAELTGPGDRHEEDGPGLLEKHGVTPGLARFARTHARWDQEGNLALEDLLVAVSDHIWKGSRNDQLEMTVAARISMAAHVSEWLAFAFVDETLSAIAARAEERLPWQRA